MTTQDFSTLPPVLILPTKYVTGWDGNPANIPSVERFALTPVNSIWSEYQTDAHFVQYAISGEHYSPRLNKTATSTLAAMQRSVVALWCVIDVDNPNHANWSPELWHETLARLQRLPEIGQAGFYVTNGGYRLVWAIQPMDISLFEDFKRQFHEHLLQHGIEADPLFDWTRTFRLPFVNRDGVNQRHYSDFSGLGYLSWIPPRPLAKGVFPKGYRLESAHSGQMPDLSKIGKPTAAEFSELKGHPLQQRIKDGLALVDGTGRNSATISAIGSIIERLNTCDPYVVFRLLHRSVQAQFREGDPENLSWLWNKCCYFCDLKRGEQENTEQAHAINKAASLDATGRAAEKLGIAPERVSEHLIACTSTALYFLDERTMTYSAPRPQRELLRGLRKYCPTLCPTTVNDKGANLADNELISRYGFPVRSTVLVIGQRHNTLDVNNGILYEGCGYIRDELQPEYSQEIDHWLRLLGHKHSEHLLDWLAVVTDLHAPCCALYIRGPRSAGKGMLVEGLARLWGTSPTPYEDLTSNFNGKLADCPLVWIDEQAATSYGQTNTTAIFRKLIGTSMHTLNRKYRDAATLQGNLRLLIMANNSDALQVREDLTKEDLGAMIERLGFIHTDDKAGQYLESIGGRSTTEKWVAGDGIARHVLWLKQNRRVNPGPRFLVHGWNPDLALELLTFGGLNGQILIGMVYYIIEDTVKNPKIIAGNGKLLVNSKALQTSWGIIFNNREKTPADWQLGNALQAISTGQTRERISNQDGTENYVRFWEIDLPSLYKVAEKNNICDAETLTAKINRPVAMVSKPSHGNVVTFPGVAK
jgi:hypothetical protein